MKILHRRPSWKVVLSLLLLGTLILAAVATIPPAQLALRRGETASRFTHIRLALMCYCETYGCYPPQYLTDQQGKRAHSWRVLLLPELGYEELYRRYRFDEPWNGPHNRLLATKMPQEYRSPFLDSRSTITQYVGIAGKDTLWEGTTPLRRKVLERGFSNPLIWFVEAANSDIEWMDPRDIPLEQALVGINVPGGIQSNYSDGLPVEIMSLGYDWVPVGTSADAFRAMLTISDNTDKPQENGYPSAPSKRSPTRPETQGESKTIEAGLRIGESITVV